MKNSYFLFFWILLSCTTMQKPNTENSKINKTPSATEDGKMVVSGQIVSKEMIRKNNKPGGFGELYYRLSVQDYFIKFCESAVSKKELELFVNTDSSFVSVTLEVEIREGNWDICKDDPIEMQSRIGKYIVVHRIVK